MAGATGREHALAGHHARRLGSRPDESCDVLSNRAGPRAARPLPAEMTTYVPVLLYHSVNDRGAASDRRWTVSPGDFASHVDAITASGRTAMSISAIAEALRGERP